MPRYDNAKLIHKETDEETLQDSEVPISGEARVKFEFISVLPESNSEGRIIADGQEVFPSVLNARIQPPISEELAGCWLDGHFGYHNAYRVVDRAKEYGFKVPEEYRSVMDKYHENGDETGFESMLTEEEWEAIHGQGELSEKATNWLEELAPKGYVFVWDAGEFSLMNEEDAEMF